MTRLDTVPTAIARFQIVRISTPSTWGIHVHVDTADRFLTGSGVSRHA
jgi:hypothetical protein